MSIAVGVLSFLGVVLFLYLVPVGLWIAAWSSGAPVGIFTLIAMRLRRVVPGDIVNPRISAIKAGLNLTTDDLESHYLAGGNVKAVVNALISARKAISTSTSTKLLPLTSPGVTSSKRFKPV